MMLKINNIKTNTIVISVIPLMVIILLSCIFVIKRQGNKINYINALHAINNYVSKEPDLLFEIVSKEPSLLYRKNIDGEEIFFKRATINNIELLYYNSEINLPDIGGKEFYIIFYTGYNTNNLKKPIMYAIVVPPTIADIDFIEPNIYLDDTGKYNVELSSIDLSYNLSNFSTTGQY